MDKARIQEGDLGTPAVYVLFGTNRLLHATGPTGLFSTLEKAKAAVEKSDIDTGRILGYAVDGDCVYEGEVFER